MDESAAFVVFAKALALEAGAELGLVARVTVHMLEFCDGVSELAVFSVSIRMGTSGYDGGDEEKKRKDTFDQ
jgi:hypothetical protein